MGQVIKLEGFAGLIPRLSPRLLPPQAATRARNTKLLSGELRGFRQPTEQVDLSYEPYTVRRAVRLIYDDPYYGESDHWLTFDKKEVDVVRSPIVNDLYDRYYWAGDGRPKYNTINRITNGLDPYYLGIPEPLTSPTVTPPIGSPEATRAYVVTFVSELGEEGPPCTPVLATGGSGGTWQLTSLPTTVPDASNRAITAKRIYRTVPGNSSALYYYVDEVGINDTAYNDDWLDDEVVLNNTLESTTWAEPPTDLQGFVLMPNGYLVGWAKRRLCFSEPYRPWAWPAEYELATEFDIVGMVVWGSTLIIGTKSRPYMGGGVTPASFTMQKMDAVEPCLSRKGMVATIAGAYYPSLNGLVLVNSAGATVVTQDLVTKEEWEAYNPAAIFATQFGLQYIAFNSSSFGFIFNPTEPTTKLVELDRFIDVNGIETDYYSGVVNLLIQDRVVEWDPANTERLFYRWRSKEFHFPKHVNFGAVKIKFNTEAEDISGYVQNFYGAYNVARFDDGPLNMLMGHPAGMAQKTFDQYMEEIQYDIFLKQWRTPVGGGPEYPLLTLSEETAAVRFIAYVNAGDGQGFVKVYDNVIFDEEIMRLPTGFKRDVWQFEVISNTNIYSITIAETGKDLGKA